MCSFVDFPCEELFPATEAHPVNPRTTKTRIVNSHVAAYGRLLKYSFRPSLNIVISLPPQLRFPQGMQRKLSVRDEATGQSDLFGASPVQSRRLYRWTQAVRWTGENLSIPISLALNTPNNGIQQESTQAPSQPTIKFSHSVTH